MTQIKDLSTASSEQMRALQMKELEILKYFKNICDENQLTFFLGGGSCIGALRHKGFIPWDDDVDVFMLRKDYERLYSNWSTYSTDPQYSLCRSTIDQNYRHAAMTLNDNQTTFINFRTSNEDVNQGIGIDILPIDYLADNYFSRIWQRINAVIFSIFINQRLPDNQGALLHWLTKIPLILIKNPKRRVHIWKFSERQMTKYSKKKTEHLVELVSGLRSILRPLNPSWFDQAIDQSFEDTTMPIAVGADKYLKFIFGDYMQLPSPEDRKAKHHTAFIDTENPYQNYRGKYYLK